MSKSEIASLFEFESAQELEKFLTIIESISEITTQHYPKIEILIKKQKADSFYSAEVAFKKILSFACLLASSKELSDFYKSFVQLKYLDINIAEITVDTLADIARFRASSSSAMQEDKEFFAYFISYNNVSNALNDSLEGMLNAIMGIYALVGASYEERKMHLIKETVPVIASKAESLALLWGGKCKDAWLIFFISCLKDDLEHLTKINDSRFRNFFSHQEYAKIQKMSQDTLQSYLSTAVVENSNLRETKTLLKEKQEIDFLLKEINQIEKILNLTPEMLRSAKRQLGEKSKLDMEILHHE